MHLGPVEAAFLVTCLVLEAVLLSWIGCRHVWWIGFRELRIRRQMQREGRFMDWDEVERRLSLGEGTLDYVHKYSGRFLYWPEGETHPPAYWTNCPLRYWSPYRLRRRFPNAHIVISYQL